MTIHTIHSRFQFTKTSRNALKELQKQAQKGGHWDWSLRPTLKDDDYIEIDQLFIDDEIQRDPFDSARLTKLKKMIASPDTRRFKRVQVVRREYLGDKRLMLVDGQGRVLAAYVCGQTRVPYDVIVFNSKQDEAQYFLSQGKDMHSITGWERHSVILNIPEARLHTQSVDVENVINATKIDYKPQQIKNYDCSKAFSGIKDSIVNSDKASAGKRKGLVTIGIINLMKKHATKVGGVLTFRSDLFYPFTEFCMSYKSPLRTGLKKLEERIISLKNKNGGSLTLDDMAHGMSLGIAKNQNDKRACASKIKKW